MYKNGISKFMTLDWYKNSGNAIHIPKIVITLPPKMPPHRASFLVAAILEVAAKMGTPVTKLYEA